MNLAVGAEAGYADLFDHASNDGSEPASVFRKVIEDVHRSTPTSHRVRMTTLEAFIEEQRIDKVDLLKIDTEGTEFKVLAGAGKALSENRIELIHFEFNVTNVASRVFMKDSIRCCQAISCFECCLMVFSRCHHNGLNVAEIEVFAFQNIVAIHASTRLLPAATS
jgi:hypothetical protein